ncbi:hypothetical protein CEQ90_00595 [Lewinellaceae bacterium SD302]|nr:hypothetical protein CEQ90_00595 [Lewinellaceae bacterium SD302]
MRQFTFSGLAFLLIFTFFSCNDDFELEAPYADIPVVNAYLDINEDDNFVRVQKAFLGAGGNAIISAATPDSLYYNEEGVIVSFGVGNNDPVEMDLVDGADFGIERDTGAFANSPNLLYRVPPSIELDGGEEISITVNRSGEPDAVAQTTMIGPIDMSFPVDQAGLRLANYAQTLSVRWRVSDAARIFDVSMNIRVREFDVSDPSDNITRTLTWVMAPSFRRESEQNLVQLQVSNEAFWQFLGNALEEDDNVFRQLVDFDIIVTGVGMEVEEAIDLANANGGITSAQSIPVFTNVENGLGLVTSRSSGGSFNLFLEGPGAGDTLRNGVYTGDLGFQ